MINSKSLDPSELVSLSISQFFDLNSPVLLWDIKTSQLSHNAKFSDCYQSLSNVSELMPIMTPASAKKLLACIGGLQSGHSFCLDVEMMEQKTPCVLWGVALNDDQVMLVFNQHYSIELNSISHQNLETLYNAVNSFIWYLDKKGKILFANQAAESVVALNSCKHKSLLEVVPNWGEAQRRQDEILKAIKNGIAVLGTLESCQEADAEHWYKVDKIPTHDASGNVTGLMLLMVDVTIDEINKKALTGTEQRYREFIRDISDAVFRIDLYPPIEMISEVEQQVKDIQSSGVLVESNLAMAQMAGVDDTSTIIGGSAFIKGLFSKSDEILSEFIQFDYKLQNREIPGCLIGQEGYYSLTLSGVVENGLLVRIWGSARDVSENHDHLAKLEYQASHDLLTDLPNRAALYRAIDTQIANTSEHNRFALILIDLDHFKEINDTLGHEVGDSLLTLIGPRLMSDIEDHQAFIARLGGDEFAVLCPKIRNNQQAVILGYRILDAIREPFELEDFTAEISASVGISIYPDQADDVTKMMRYADVAMYQAKADNTGVSVYRSSYDTHTPQRLAMMTELGKAIRENQLELYYQPKIEINSGQVYGFEALLRWDHPEVGFIPPVEFIPLAEVSNIIHPLTKWVVESSIIQAKAWLEAGYKFTIAANLSAHNLSDEYFVENLAVLLEKHQLPAEYLELEITESSIMSHPDRALTTLNGLSELGILLSIDDFGTGYSSLAYLKRLPVSTLKIDSSFVMDILEDAQDSIIVNSTIHLAHNLGLDVIAEGVEDKAILSMLQDMNCDKAQGYYMAKPMPAKEVQVWLDTEQWYSIE